jgi:Probable metallopeptidase family (DUF6775)
MQLGKRTLKRSMIKKMTVYLDCALAEHEIQEYCSFIRDILSSEVHAQVLSTRITHEEQLNMIAAALAGIRITQLDSLKRNDVVFPVEIEYERKHIISLAQPSQCLYDGFEFQRLLRKEFALFSRQKTSCSIVLTDRKLLTWEEDSRYHLRSVIFGIPCIISRVGIIEAPAKPREYYLLKHAGNLLELQQWLVDNRHRYLEMNDARMSEVIKGYLLQCCYYIQNSEIIFCDDQRCALYNSHWQEEVLQAQLYHKLCANHQIDKKSVS